MKERKVDGEKNEGKCPYCDSAEYERLGLNPSDDAIFVDCNCMKCGKEFKETFYLKYQEWD
jgi:hypothetical protein